MCAAEVVDAAFERRVLRQAIAGERLGREDFRWLLREAKKTFSLEDNVLHLSDQGRGLLVVGDLHANWPSACEVFRRAREKKSK